MPVANPQHTGGVARLVKRCLEEGRRVEIERLGVFQRNASGAIEFIENRRPSVFLAYADEDAAQVERLFNVLEKADFDPWMDRRKLLPGQNWPRAIEGAIDTADFFVACLSKSSVRKRGNFQSEMRYALDCARRTPFDDVYFIPVRLEPCTVPTRIQQQLQYLDLYPNLDRGAAALIDLIRRELSRRALR